jgi:integrase
MGIYPDVTLAEARTLHQEARSLVAKNISPSGQKKANKRANRLNQERTVKAIAEGWFAEMAQNRSNSWKENTRRWLEEDVYKEFGASRLISELTHQDVVMLLRRVAKARGARSATYVRQLVSRILRAAKALDPSIEDHARAAMDVVVAPKPKSRRPLERSAIPVFLDAVEKYRGRRETKLAIRLLLYTFVRKRELIEATWDEFDLDRREWRIGAGRMKMQTPHIVPLSLQAIETLRELKGLNPESAYVFPHHLRPNHAMHASTLNRAFDSIGFAHLTPHGLRSLASTVLNEHGFRADAIERQLAHVERNKSRAAYNHAMYLPERRKMMQNWSDFVDGVGVEDNVLSLRKQA